MTTFSQLVDEMVRESKRPDMRDDIARYANQTIRELHFEPVGNTPIFYKGNYREDQFVITDSARAVWNVPRPETFQAEICFRLDGAVTCDGNPVYAVRSSPGPSLNGKDHFYYSAGDSFVLGGLRGVGNVGSTISVAYFEFPRSLKYYDADCRPATWDDDTGFKYDAAWMCPGDPVNDALVKEQALCSVTNWLIRRWHLVVEEGLRAKVYKRVGDQMRATTCYSLYQQMRRGIYTTEVADLTGYYKA